MLYQFCHWLARNLRQVNLPLWDLLPYVLKDKDTGLCLLNGGDGPSEGMNVKDFFFKCPMQRNAQKLFPIDVTASMIFPLYCGWSLENKEVLGF